MKRKIILFSLVVFLSSSLFSDRLNEIKKIMVNGAQVFLARKGTKHEKVEKHLKQVFGEQGFQFSEHLLLPIDEWDLIKLKQFGFEYAFVYEVKLHQSISLTIEIRHMDLAKGNDLVWNILYSYTANTTNLENWEKTLVHQVGDHFGSKINPLRFLPRRVEKLENDLREQIAINESLSEQIKRLPSLEKFQEMQKQMSDLKSSYEELRTRFKSSLEIAQKASQVSEQALKEGYQANDQAQMAISAASKAREEARQAFAKSKQTQTTADKAKVTAQKAIKKAEKSIKKAQDLYQDFLQVKNSFREPDYQSEWTDVSLNDHGEIIHNLGVRQFSNFQIVLRESPQNDDEIVIGGMSWGRNYKYESGMTCYVDQSDQPLKKIKWSTESYWIFVAPRASRKGQERLNWSIRSPQKAQFRIRIWK